MRIAWQAWRAYAKRAGQYQTRVWLTMVYLVIVGPVSLVIRVAGIRLLDTRGRQWIDRSRPDTSLEGLRRQF